MEDKRGPAAGQLFLDKEKKLLQFILIAADQDNGKKIAVYQALTGDYKVYAKELSSFLREMISYEPPTPYESSNLYEASTRLNEMQEIEEIKTRLKETASVPEEKEAVSPVLLAFLDADTYEEKLNVLVGGRKNLTDRIVNHMAISIDCIVEDGDMEERINNLIYCLKTHARFEDKRLR